MTVFYFSMLLFDKNDFKAVELLLQHEVNKRTKHFRNLLQVARGGQVTADVVKVEMLPWLFKQTMVTPRNLEYAQRIVNCPTDTESWRNTKRKREKNLRLVKSFLKLCAQPEE